MTLETVRQFTAPLLLALRRFGVVLIVAMLAVFAAGFLYSRQDELAEAGQLLRTVSPVWLLVLAGLQLIVLSAAAFTYKFMFKRLGHSLRWHQLAEIQLKRLLVGTVTPLGGPPSLYVFVRSLWPHSVPAGDTLITASTRSIMGLVAFVSLLVPALLLQRPSGLVLSGALGLALVLLTAISVSVYLLRGTTLPRVFESHAPGFAVEFIKNAREHRLTAIDFVPPLLLGMTSHLATASMLYAGLHAVGHEAHISTVMIGYVIGKLFFMMAPFFQGVGVVELGMALALQQAGVPAGVAVSAALLYRVGDLWLPLSWGASVQLARLQPLQRFARHCAAQTSKASTLSAELPTRMPAMSRQVVAMSHAALATELLLVAAIGVWVHLGSPLTGMV